MPLTGRPVPLRTAAVTGTGAAADARWQRELNERELVEPVDWSAGPLARAVVLTGHDPAAGSGTTCC
ncbi:hypothetical protein ACFQ2B_29490 [Streptomyces stramineus]